MAGVAGAWRRGLGPLAAASAAALIAASPASAGVVSAAGDQSRFEGVPGEANRLSFFSDPSGGVGVRDDGAPLVAGEGCQSTGERTARCLGGWSWTVATGDGDDSVAAAAGVGSFTVLGGDGHDTIEGYELDGGAGNDVLRPAQYGRAARGGPGHDRIEAGAMSPYDSLPLDGGDGNDTIVAPSGSPNVDGGEGDDHISVSGSTRFGQFFDPYRAWPQPGTYLQPQPPPPIDANVHGGGGDDLMEGADGSDALAGGPGNDRLLGHGGRDGLEGGDGADVLAAGGSGDAGAVAYPGGSVVQPDDRLVGGAGDDVLAADSGLDLLEGGDGDDRLDGGDGDDLLEGGAGADAVDGGPGGRDRISYYTRAQPVDVDLTRPGGDGERGENDSIAADVEIVALSKGDDRFRAAGGAVEVNGAGGADELVGSDAGDRLDGDLDSDRLSGGGGDDVLDGGRDVEVEGTNSTRHAGDDVLDGGAGNDRLLGRQGSDVLVGGTGDDHLVAADFSRTNFSPLIPLAGGDRLSCGAGGDAGLGDYYDELPLDCEHVGEGTPAWRVVKPARSGRVRLTVRCAWKVARPCRGSVRLVWIDKARTGVEPVRGQATSPGRPPPDLSKPPAGCRSARRVTTVASGRLDIRAGRVNSATPKLSARGARILRGRRCLMLKAVFTFRAPDRSLRQMTRTLALRSRGAGR